jgi:hypothetical protein
MDSVHQRTDVLDFIRRVTEWRGRGCKLEKWISTARISKSMELFPNGPASSCVFDALLAKMTMKSLLTSLQGEIKSRQEVNLSKAQKIHFFKFSSS